MSYYEKILKIILRFTPLLFVVGFVPIFPESFYLCSMGVNCYEVTHNYENIGAFISFFSAVFFCLSGLLLVRLKSPAVFLSWKKFALLWIPISAIFVLSASSSGGGSIGIGGSIDREIVTWWFAGLFFIISIIIIIRESLKLQGK